MNTQLNVNVELLEKAKKVLQITDDKSAVEMALLRGIEKTDLQKLKSYFGKLNLDVDMDALRGRNRVSWGDENDLN